MASGTFDTLNPYTFKGTSPSATPGFFTYGIRVYFKVSYFIFFDFL